MRWPVSVTGEIEPRRIVERSPLLGTKTKFAVIGLPYRSPGDPRRIRLQEAALQVRDSLSPVDPSAANADEPNWISGL